MQALQKEQTHLGFKRWSWQQQS